jgi:hypothetical protein
VFTARTLAARRKLRIEAPGKKKEIIIITITAVSWDCEVLPATNTAKI